MLGSRPLPVDRGLLVRMAITVLLLAALYVVFIALLVAAGLGAVAVAIIALVVFLAQYFGAERLALAALGAYEMRADEVPELYATVERLCGRARVPMVRIAVVETPMPNAFTVGRAPASATICVTTGLLALLDEDELAAVLGHELTHVIRHDVMLLTLTSVFASLAASLAALGRRLQARLRRRRGRDEAEMPWFLISILAGLVFILSYVPAQLLSRGRELGADRGGALISGRADALATALTKISRTLGTLSAGELRGACGELSMFYVVPVDLDASIATLCSTHPSLPERLRALGELAAREPSAAARSTTS